MTPAMQPARPWASAASWLTMARRLSPTVSPNWSRKGACRRLGELLKETPKNVGAKGSKVTGSKRDPVKDTTPTLADAGIDKHLADRVRKLAGMVCGAILTPISSGDTIRAMKERGELAERGDNQHTRTSQPAITTLSDLGLTRSQSSRYQQEARWRSSPPRRPLRPVSGKVLDFFRT